MSVFLGWLPDPATQAALAALRQRIESILLADAPGHDWRSAAQRHMTLRFLGESIDAPQRMRLDAAMDALTMGTAAVDAAITGTQYWPHARVLVARIDATDALKALLKRLEAGMQACGFAKERAQTAHITLAYLPRGSRPPDVSDAATTASCLRIDRIHLLQTMPGGYMSLAAWPLAPWTTAA